MTKSKYKISILLAAYKSEHLLDKIFLKSVFRNTSVPIEVIVYDNGGNGRIDPDYEYKIGTDASVCVKTIGNGENVGLNKALNECAKVATGEYFYLPHTDMCLLPGWDAALLRDSRNLPPTTFLLCSRSIEKASHIPMQLLKDFGTSLKDFNEEGLYDFFKSYKDKGIVTGYRMPFFGHMKLLEKMQKYNQQNNICQGPFDDSYFSYATDNDLFFTSYEVGVRRFWLIQESVVYHLSGHSNKQQTVDKDDKTPYIRLCKKWSKYNVTMNIDESENRLVTWNVRIK